MKVLVTGADGFVGRWLCEHLEAEGDEVWRATGRPVDGPTDRASTVDLRLADDALRICEWAQPDAIYHLAAVAFGPDAERSPSEALSTTVGGTMHILDAASRLPNPPVVLIPSSAEVYGIPASDAPLTEADPVRPVNAYGCTKAAQELVALAYHRSNAVPVVIGRAFNHIGPGQRPDFVIASFARQLSIGAPGGEGIELQVGNLTTERDFTDVRDVVVAYRLMVAGGHAGAIFNIAQGVAVAVRDILDWLVEISGKQVEIRVHPDRVRRVDPKRIVGDSSRLREATGWTPRYPLSETLQDIWTDAVRRQAAS